MSSELPKSESLPSVIAEIRPPLHPSKVIRKTQAEWKSSSIVVIDKGGPKSTTVPNEVTSPGYFFIYSANAIADNFSTTRNKSREVMCQGAIFQ